LKTDTHNTERRVFLVSLILLAMLGSLAYGIAIWYFKLWPYKDIVVLGQHARNLKNYGVWARKSLFVPAPEQASRKRINIIVPDEFPSGYRAIMGWDATASEHAVWLFDSKGKERHRWGFHLSSIYPENKSGLSGKSHALAILSDGSIVVNLEGEVMARLDACSKPVWMKRGSYHHSLDLAEDGSMWIWRGESHHFSHYQFLHNFDPRTGKVIKELSLVDDFIKTSPNAEVIFRLPKNYTFKHTGEGPMTDLFHTNDVEVLGKALADKFPQFRAGDLLVSLRNINLVAVLAPDEKIIRWWMQGPWIMQHDPDFGPDGRISVYNNNMNRRHSNIVFVDPESNSIDFLPASGSSVFYSREMGKHQRLPNGNVLITVPKEGRVIETTATGKPVFEFNNIYSEKVNATVANSRWLPVDYFKTFPSCKN